MGARRSFAFAGAITGIAALAVFAAAELAEPSFFGFLHSNDPQKSARGVPPCPVVVGAKPVDLSRCQHRVVKGAAKPEPYPVIPALFNQAAKP